MSAIADPSVNGPWNTPPSQNGRLPTSTATGQASATAANASLSLNLSVVSDLTPILNMETPMKPENNSGIKKATAAVFSPSSHQVIRKLNESGISIATIVHPTIRDNTSRRICPHTLNFLSKSSTLSGGKNIVSLSPSSKALEDEGRIVSQSS